MSKKQQIQDIAQPTVNSKYVLTAIGLQNLKDELFLRINTTRREIADKIDEATKQGDLSENAMYTAALEEQQMNESKIEELSEVVKNAVLTQISSKNSTIEIGEKFTLLDMDKDSQMTLTLVGDEEANPFLKKISSGSPIGSAILGKEIGDIVNVKTPNGVRKLKIIKLG